MRKWKPPSDAYYWANRRREKIEACKDGFHKSGEWKKHDDGRRYWDCMHGCGHRHFQGDKRDFGKCMHAENDVPTDEKEN